MPSCSRQALCTHSVRTTSAGFVLLNRIRCPNLADRRICLYSDPVVIGGVLGAISGYYGRHTDNIIMRLLDVLYAIPGILLAIAIIAAFGANTVNLILALSVGAIPTYARTMRANVLLVSTFEYVDAARAGSSNFRLYSSISFLTACTHDCQIYANHWCSRHLDEQLELSGSRR